MIPSFSLVLRSITLILPSHPKRAPLVSEHLITTEHVIWVPETRYGGILLAVQLSQCRQIRHFYRSGRGAFVLCNHLQGIFSSGLTRVDKAEQQGHSGTWGWEMDNRGTTNFRVDSPTEFMHAAGRWSRECLYHRWRRGWDSRLGFDQR